MLEFPIDIAKTPLGEFQATWADFPAIAPAVGKDPQAAFNALMDSSFSQIADAVGSGNHPAPSEADGRPVVSFGSAAAIAPHHISRLINVTPRGTKMSTYSWTNDLAYVE